MAVDTTAGTFYGQAMKAGDIYTIAGTGTTGFSGDGGPATAAKLDGPFGPATDAAGNVVFADRLNQRVRVVADTLGHVLRPGHDRRAHLHHRRERHTPATPATAARPPRPSSASRPG